MSNPIPLTDPSGTVRAWMCGCCGCVPPFDPSADDFAIVRGAADRCCTCYCGNPVERGQWRCAACTEERRRDADAALAKRRETHRECGACQASGFVVNCGAGSAYALCDVCDGEGWLLREEPRP